MLILKLKKQDRIVIGNMTMHIRHVLGGRVSIAIDAPRSVPIHSETPDFTICEDDIVISPPDDDD